MIALCRNGKIEPIPQPRRRSREPFEASGYGASVARTGQDRLREVAWLLVECLNVSVWESQPGVIGNVETPTRPLCGRQLDARQSMPHLSFQVGRVYKHHTRSPPDTLSFHVRDARPCSIDEIGDAAHAHRRGREERRPRCRQQRSRPSCARHAAPPTATWSQAGCDHGLQYAEAVAGEVTEVAASR